MFADVQDASAEGVACPADETCTAIAVSQAMASMYRLRITQRGGKPDPTGAVELFFEFAKASREMGFRARFCMTRGRPCISCT